MILVTITKQPNSILLSNYLESTWIPFMFQSYDDHLASLLGVIFDEYKTLPLFSTNIVVFSKS